MKRPIDPKRYLPLGMDPQRVRNWAILLLVFGGGCSMLFFVRYLDARGRLYVYEGGRLALLPNAVMASFGSLIEGIFSPMAVVAAWFLVLPVLLYLYHYQGSRSIYTMKRLPDRWELWRRCLPVPILGILACAVLTLILLGVYYLVWRFCTPAICLPI